MKRTSLALSAISTDPRAPLAGADMVLTAGDFARGDYNAMTVGWGGYGIMWNRPFVLVVVRPVRYSYEFMNRHESFTLSAFPAGYERALAILGSKSGRDGDKIAEAGLSLEASLAVAAPSFAEADFVLECRKTYWQDLDPSHFLDPRIMEQYPRGDFHRIYFGEILAASRA